MKTSTIPTLLGPDGMTSLREYAGYHGGGSGFGGQLRAWNPPSESVDAALLPNFTRGNARADDLVRNNGYAANAIQLHQDHIVGSFFRLSHRPSWRYLGIGEEEARAFSREVEAAWKEFAEDGQRYELQCRSAACQRRLPASGHADRPDRLHRRHDGSQ